MFLKFLGPETSQESLKRPKKAPKRHPKSSKTPQKKDPKLDPKINKFWTNFGVQKGFQKGQPKLLQKGRKNNQILQQFLWMWSERFFVMSIFWCLKVPLLVPILEPNLRTRFAKEAAKMNTEGHQELQRPKNSLFKTLKNSRFLHIFGSRDLPREPQEAQEGSQEAPKELQNLKKNIK